METHPREDELDAFSAGKLDEESLALVEEHLTGCADCRETLKSLPPDRLTLLLREGNSGLGVPPDGCESDAGLPDGVARHRRYRVLGEVGRGGMGVVYKAEHRLMKRVVALKVISPRLTASGAAVARFRREVEAVAKLSHGNIAAAYDADEAEGQLVLVEEYVEGTDLAQVVREQGPLPVSRACGYAHQAALALQHAHERGILHRDIKPSNLIVTGDGRVKVLDFGLAALRDRPDESASGGSAGGVSPPADSPLTDFGQGMGTADYMAPEQAKDANSADARSDIYSLGKTLGFLLTGRADAAEPADAPSALVGVLGKLTAPDPEQRFRTMTDVAAALAPFTAGSKGRGGRGPLLLLTSYVAGLAGLVAAWLWLGGALQDAKFHPLPLDEAATATTTRPLFTDQAFEKLIFPSWGMQRVFGVPFVVLDPLGDRRKNAVVLHGPLAPPANKLPKVVTVRCGFRAKAIHLLGGVAGWGYQGPGDGPPGSHNHKSVSMVVRLAYDDGTEENHKLLNGVHICDFCMGEEGEFYQAEASTFALRLKDGPRGPKQIRYLAVRPGNTRLPIAQLDFVKAEGSITSPVVMAVTVEEP